MRTIKAEQISLYPFQSDSPLLSAAVRVYCKTWRHRWAPAYHFISRYAAYPGFHGVIAATRKGKPIGMGFGATAFPGNWWFDRVSAEIGASHPRLQDAWVLVELSVLKHHRNQGVGSEIIQNLLQHHSHSRVLLSTQQANTGARHLYERLGWTYVHDELVFAPGQDPYVIMCKEMVVGGMQNEKAEETDL